MSMFGYWWKLGVVGDGVGNGGSLDQEMDRNPVEKSQDFAFLRSHIGHRRSGEHVITGL